MLQQADVIGHAVGALGDTAETGEDAAVYLAGIGLAAHRKALFEAEAGGQTAVHLIDLGLAAVKQVHKAGLGARGAAAAQEFQRRQHVVQLLHVRQQVLHPQRGPLAHGDGLCRLIVGVAQCRRGGVFFREGRQIRQHRQQMSPQIDQSVPVQDQIGVIRDVAAGGAQMDDARRRWGRLAVGVHVGHHVVAHLPLPLGGDIVVDVGDVGLQLRGLRLCDGEPQLVLHAGQRRPQPPPGLVAAVVREQPQHIVRGVAGRQRGLVGVMGHGIPPYFI